MVHDNIILLRGKMIPLHLNAPTYSEPAGFTKAWHSRNISAPPYLRGRDTEWLLTSKWPMGKGRREFGKSKNVETNVMQMQYEHEFRSGRALDLFVWVRQNASADIGMLDMSILWWRMAVSIYRGSNPLSWLYKALSECPCIVGVGERKVPRAMKMMIRRYGDGGVWSSDIVIGLADALFDLLRWEAREIRLGC